MQKASSLEHALLGLLKQRPQSGYDLRKAFATTPLRHFSDSPGSIYPALRRLQQRKWIEAARIELGRKRQMLQVTAAGHQALLAWLRQPVGREDVIWCLDDLMLRFAFQGGNVPKKVTLAFLAQLEQELAAYLRELRQYAISTGMVNETSTGALAFASGVDGYEAQLNWTKRARKRLTEAVP